jgi:LAGLIDADG DNA endonuclease family
MVLTYPKIIKRKQDKRTGKFYKSIAFKTAVFDYLNEYHTLFYENKKKIVPKNIQELLTARGLAYWIMDDGYYNNNILNLCTDCYAYEEVNLLVETLNSNFSLKAKSVKRIKENGEICWRIRFKSSSINKIREIVKPYIHQSMFYKIQ